MKANNKQTIICSICNNEINDNIGDHIKKDHGQSDFEKEVLEAKEGGMPDSEIGDKFNITFKQLEKIITENYGINISILKRPKKIFYWHPKRFEKETTTVWSFEQRGNWATHDGRYRGNWSPYIPRNIISMYSKPGDIVLDYFIGGGTTAVEAKLLGRQCIARDINPAAIALTRENLNFDLPKNLFDVDKIYEPELSVGDARRLSDILEDSIELIVAHPPYAGIINYSSKVDGDLSKLSIDSFLKEMGKVAAESYRILKPGRKCAILIGDTRRQKSVVPMGFLTIEVFLNAGFVLKELVIKRQHKCKTTGFWYDRSIKYNFLLLAHEYLPIFEKSEKQYSANKSLLKKRASKYSMFVKKQGKIGRKDIESTTVWIFPESEMEAGLKRNILERYAKPNSRYMEIIFEEKIKEIKKSKDNLSLIYIPPPKKMNSENDISAYSFAIKKIASEMQNFIVPGGFLVIDIQDVRIDGLVYPMGLKLLKDMDEFDNFKIREIIVVTSNSTTNSLHLPLKNNSLTINHRYLFVYLNRDRE